MYQGGEGYNCRDAANISANNNVFIISVGDSQQTQNICITFVQRRPNVFDVGPTLYKCYTNVLCLLGTLIISPP